MASSKSNWDKLQAHLRSRNRCLREFLELTSSHLKPVSSGDLSGLSQLEKRREAILRALDLFERKIGECVASIGPQPGMPAVLSQVRALENERVSLVEEIGRVDSIILSRIRQEQESLKKGIAESEKNKNILGKFRAGAPSGRGSELDEKF